MSDSPEQSRAFEDFNAAADSESGAATVGKLLMRLLMSLLIVVVLGAASALGALTFKPELVEYLAFIPGMESSGNSACSFSNPACSASVPYDSCCSVAADVGTCCGAEGTCSDSAIVEAACESTCEKACSDMTDVADIGAVAGESESSATAAQ